MDEDFTIEVELLKPLLGDDVRYEGHGADRGFICQPDWKPEHNRPFLIHGRLVKKANQIHWGHDKSEDTGWLLMKRKIDNRNILEKCSWPPRPFGELLQIMRRKRFQQKWGLPISLKPETHDE